MNKIINYIVALAVITLISINLVMAEDAPIVTANPSLATAPETKSVAGLPIAKPPGFLSSFAAQEPSSASQPGVTRLFQGLAVCLAVFFVGIHLYKKYVLKGQYSKISSLKIIEKMSINSKSSLMIVEVEGHKILLANTVDGISLIKDLSGDTQAKQPKEDSFFNFEKELSSLDSNHSALEITTEEQCKQAVNYSA